MNDKHNKPSKRWHQRWAVRVPALLVGGGLVAALAYGVANPVPQEGPAAPAAPAGDTAAFLAGLAEVSPGLVEDEERAVRRAENVCQETADGKPEATTVANTRERFSGPGVALTDDQAVRVVELARLHLCGGAR